MNVRLAVPRRRARAGPAVGGTDTRLLRPQGIAQAQTTHLARGCLREHEAPALDRAREARVRRTFGPTEPMT
jgi:hypothetical protein